MKVLVIGNFSDVRCGFMNFSNQTYVALQHAGHDVRKFDGTYSRVYARHQQGIDGFLPPEADQADVIHVVWHPATLNHYSGAKWPAGPVLSVWNGCPAAWCPFNDAMDIKWGVLGTEPQHAQLFYPIPDWVEQAKHYLAHGVSPFTVGYSGVRGDGLGELRRVCTLHGWRMNFSQPDRWYPIEGEIMRLCASTVNVGWYGAEHDDRSGSAMMCLASHRPFLCNRVRMFTHVLPYVDKHEIYSGEDLEQSLLGIEADWQEGELRYPGQILQDYSWSRACQLLEDGWRGVRK